MEIRLKPADALTYAGAQNFIPVIQSLELVNDREEAVSDLTVTLQAEPEFAPPLILPVSRVEAGAVYRLPDPEWALRHDFLAGLKEGIRGRITVRVSSAEGDLAECSVPVEVLAYEEWAGFRQLPELVLAFVQPNSAAVAELLRQASGKLLTQYGKPLAGYQSADRDSVARQIGALYAAVSDWAIHYVNPPASFTGTGQKIRLPERLRDERLGTCLDLSLLLVACLEQAGLNPLLFLEEGHAWVGCWLLDQTLPNSSVDNREQIRKRIDAGELIAFEAVGVTPQSALSLAQAIRKGAERLDEGHAHRFDLAMDVRRAREALKILPLALREAAAPVNQVEDGARINVIEDVVLPPLGPDVVLSGSSAAPEDRNRIDIWRARLLDLTLRNKLINFKPGKQAIPLFAAEPAAIEDRLAEGKSLRLKSLRALLPESDPRSADQHARATQASRKEHQSQEALARGELLADLEATELEERLTEIFRSARTSQEEGGANTLFLVLGMLKWSDGKHGERTFQAPLVMVPVTLERQSINSGFSLKRHDDDTVVNPTLLQLLEYQFELRIAGMTGAAELPQDESGVDIPAIWAAFRAAVVNLPGFEVLPAVWLGQFSFTKYLMWKDLTDRLDDILQSPLVRMLVNDERESSPLKQGDFTPEDRLDDERQPQDLFIPADCDSSQLAAVNAAANGLSFVLEGPPGTGKSQTITNIVADALARGRTVLFVSEKIAALSVVHERLKKLGLGPFLLELHSAKASKAEVLSQLDQALKAGGRHTVADWEQEAERLKRLRDGLNAYVHALHDRHPNGLTVYDATSRLVTADRNPPCGFRWPDPDQHSARQLDELRELARQIETVGDMVPGSGKQQLKHIRRREWSPVWQTALREDAEHFETALTEWESALAELTGQLMLPAGDGSLANMERLDAVMSVLQQFRPEYTALLADGHDRQSVALMEDVAVHGRRLRELENRIRQEWAEDILRQPVAEWSAAWRQARGFWWLKRWIAQYRFRSLLAVYQAEGRKPRVEEVTALLEQLTAHAAERHSLETRAGQAGQLLGELWRGLDTDWDGLQGAREWVEHFSETISRFPARDLDPVIRMRDSLSRRLSQLSGYLAPEAEGGRLLQRGRRAWDAFRKQWNRLAETAGIAPDLVRDDRPQVLDEMRAMVLGWQEGARYLRDWCHWQALRDDALRHGLEPLITALESGRQPWSGASRHFEDSYADWWLGQVIARTPVLQRFAAVDHERRIQEFRDTDARFAELTRRYIHARLAEKVPSGEIAPPQTPLGILKREIQKKSRHMPVRKLLSTTSGILPHLAPCMLMSPLSVAQYLDTAETRFDLVIFDEASQIPTWDAIGAIARGQQVIVVGDPKQLPPTSFFSAGSDGEGLEGDVEDLESILDECLGSGLPTHTLKWHYRSRRESLIAFSNHRYYQSQLITFPSPVTPDDGVVYHHVPGTYQRSGARTNRQEAEAVVAFIRRHFLNTTGKVKSLGVVTFSQAQQKLVEDLLDAARRKEGALDLAISAVKNEPLFIKNLENVQGDERDIILFSVCYGPDETGRVFMNFGPLNREGGHRRLNVAITRAKEQVHIFATLQPDQLDTGKTRATGVRDLKQYLEFARRGPVALIGSSSPTGMEPESPFEIEVQTWLLDQGWQVHPQVGCSSYRIDLGVIDPRAPGRYLMAVECDGASYHSAATARDRDKLRQMVLERLGWKVHRIWSTEWWNNREREQARLRQALEAALASDTVEDEPEAEQLPEIVVEDLPPEPAAAVPLPAVSPYTATALSGEAGDRFLEPSETGRILTLMRQVIAGEGPVCDSVIRRRISAAYGFRRMGNRIQQRLDTLLAGLPSRADTDGKPVYWPPEVNPADWSGLRELGDREVGEVPEAELMNCAREALKQLLVGDEDAVTRYMGNLLGHQRVTRQAQERLAVGLHGLRRQEDVQEVAGGFRLVAR